VSVYVEVGSERVEAFVRDHGPGFNLAEVPQDRFGVRESILGRMSRHGGSAGVRRLEKGTEVSLSLPVAVAQPSVAKPDSEGHPDTGQPQTPQADTWQPDTAQPKPAQPKPAQPEPVGQSDTLARPDTEGTR
jgi:hypothetical protein